MKTSKSIALHALFAAALSLVGMEVLRAQDIDPELPVSRRLCCCSVEIPASALSFLSIGELAPVATGTVAPDSTGATLIADENLSTYNSGHYVKISADGRVVCSIKILDASGEGPTTLTLASDLPSGLATGTTFEVVPCQTLEGALGANAFNLTENSIPANADQVLATVGGVIKRYHYTPGFPSFSPAQWQEVGSTADAGGTPLDPNSGLALNRIEGSAVGIEVYGIAKCKTQKLRIVPGLGFYSWPFVGDVTLDESGLQDVLIQDAIPANADQVLIESAGVIRRYHYTPGFPSFSPAQWQEVGSDTDAGSTVIPKGRAFGVDKLGSSAVELAVDDPLSF
ncbi:MAG: hypothetical protein AAGD22_06140 [Verrucomicrobiota bacterium]